MGQKLYFGFKKGISERIIIFLHGLGLDHTETSFQNYMRYNKEDTIIAPTLLGFHTNDHSRPSLPINLHVHLLNELIGAMIRIHKPDTVIVAGFSVGSDIGFDLVLTANYKIHAYIALDCNLSRKTCFLSEKLMNLKEESVLSIVTELSGHKRSFKNFQDWDNLVRYFQIVFRKFNECAKQS